MKSVFVIALAVCFVGLSSAGPIVNGFAGKCPDIPFVPNFNATGFLGSWFAIKETGRKIPCVTYNLEELAPGHYKSTVYPKKFSMEFTKKNVETFAEGMTVDFKVNPFMDGGVLKVVATDYCEFFFQSLCGKIHDLSLQPPMLQSTSASKRHQTSTSRHSPSGPALRH